MNTAAGDLAHRVNDGALGLATLTVAHTCLSAP